LFLLLATKTNLLFLRKETLELKLTAINPATQGFLFYRNPLKGKVPGIEKAGNSTDFFYEAV